MDFARYMLDLTSELSVFAANLQSILKELKIGILRLEHCAEDAGEIVRAVVGEVRLYQEISEAYTGDKEAVREIDCWVSGGRV